MTSDEVCTSGNPASDTFSPVVNPVFPVSISIVASTNPTYAGIPVTFTSTAVNQGLSPVYKWFVNGSEVGVNSPTHTYLPGNGDQVYCMLTSSETCTSGSPAQSNTINMIVTLVPVSRLLRDLNIHDMEVMCYDATSVIAVAGNPYFFNVESGANVTMIAGKKIFLLPGTTVLPGGYLHAYISNVYCSVPDFSGVSSGLGADENAFVIERASFRVYPNPTNGNFTLEQKSDFDFRNVTVEVYGMRGERILTGNIIGQQKHEFMFGDVPAGLYFVKIIAGDYVETIKLIKNR
jgi:hypothetical protein